MFNWSGFNGPVAGRWWSAWVWKEICIPLFLSWRFLVPPLLFGKSHYMIWASKWKVLFCQHIEQTLLLLLESLWAPLCIKELHQLYRKWVCSWASISQLRACLAKGKANYEITLINNAEIFMTAHYSKVSFLYKASMSDPNFPNICSSQLYAFFSLKFHAAQFSCHHWDKTSFSHFICTFFQVVRSSI